MTKELRTWLLTLPTAKNPFEAWMAYLNEIQKKVSTISASTPISPTQSQGATAGALAQITSASISAQVKELMGGQLSGYEAGVIVQQKSMDISNQIAELMGQVNLNVTLNGQAFDGAVWNAVQTAARTGINTSGSASG